MKTNLSQVLSKGAASATGSFNILDLDMAMSIIDCAEALNTPVIIGIASRHFNAVRAPVLVPSVLKAIESSNVPVALHLDHAGPNQIEMIKQALDLGFSSIMIDGSLLPLEENIEVTAKVVELSHRYNASVEGEIGGIAGEEGVADTEQDSPDYIPYTNPLEAQQFVKATRVDALAIAVGTAHGIYSSEPHINFDVIKEIQSMVSTPLVMHGATGVSDASIQKAVSNGIRKINYFSGLLQTAMDEVRAYDSKGNDFLQFKHSMQEQWRKLIAEQIKLYAKLPENMYKQA
ncbi:MAG: class II fructose-bisphosphate aldolase [Gammaproteobacteria bacterium]|nr:class II fructose-bisphosphate aldolase [Gammaproteobacteria bacterium]